MKFRLGLLLAFLLACPGVWAIIAWSLADMNNNGRSLAEMVGVYKSSIPFFAGTMKQTIIMLIGLCILSVALSLYLKPEGTGWQKGVRIFVLCVGLFTGAMLCFAMM
jgi:hypothetical protein